MIAQIAPTPATIVAPIAENPNTPLRKPRRPLVPLTFEKRMEKGAMLRVPASVEDFIYYVDKCDYTLQYTRGCIWSFIEIDEKTNTIMGQAAPIHEQIVNRLARLLGNLLQEDISDFRTYGSNLKVYIERLKSYYNPDMTITEGQPEFIKHRPKKQTVTSLLNPKLIVEVLSKGTESFDKGLKLTDYQDISSMAQIILVDPNETKVTVYTRLSANRWGNENYTNENDQIPILNQGTLRVGDIYKNLIRL
jgi:Uma2 family endonuclease